MKLKFNKLLLGLLFLEFSPTSYEPINLVLIDESIT